MIDISKFPITSHDALWGNSLSYEKFKEELPWCTAVGAWGDSLCAMGNSFNYPGRCRFLHYGYDSSIRDFMQAQHWITEACHLKPAENQYRHVVNATAFTENTVFFDKFANVIETHLRPSVTLSKHIHRWHGARLPVKQVENVFNYNLPKSYVLFQPYSTQSSKIEGHWPHWEKALELLLTFTPLHLVIVGESELTTGSHPRVLDLSGCTSSMMEVFALAERSQGVIGTCNSLSIYCGILSIPAVICPNSHLIEGSYFHRYIDVEPVKLITYESNTADFLAVVAGTFDL